jgi:hypothetical protein
MVDDRSWPLTVAVIFIVAFAIYAMTALFVAKPAYPHDALPTAGNPAGWAYPGQCCSGIDCRRIIGGEKSKGTSVNVIKTKDGYMISTTKEVIPFDSKKIKTSPDINYHWCSKGGLDTSDTICLFIPETGI